ncbi:MAG: DUF6622 family protein [Burkholderiaceae bacterium]
MFIEIIRQTPPWVFAIFAGLLWLGSSQLRPRRASLRRITLMPVAMTGLSLYGLVSAFGQDPRALGCWMLALLGVLLIALRRPAPATVRYDAATRRFELPGSVIPLLLMMGIFIVKYAVGIIEARSPQWLHDATFIEAVSLSYGLFSGLFLSRSARLWQLAFSSTRRLGDASSAAR